MRIGIDLGGTKTEVIALGDDGRELARERVASAPAYDGTVETVAGLVESVERTLGRDGTVGVGIPGAVSPRSGVIKNANSTWLNGRALHEDLSERLGREVRVRNDADCFALSEATDGAAAGARVVFGVILVCRHGNPGGTERVPAPPEQGGTTQRSSSYGKEFQRSSGGCWVPANDPGISVSVH